MAETVTGRAHPALPSAARRVLRPIEALRQGAGRIAEGDLSYRIPAQPDEMGALFDRVADLSLIHI